MDARIVVLIAALVLVAIADLYSQKLVEERRLSPAKKRSIIAIPISVVAIGVTTVICEAQRLLLTPPAHGDTGPLLGLGALCMSFGGLMAHLIIRDWKEGSPSKR